MEKQKYETCRHVQSVGQIAVYVNPGCPWATMIKGRLVSSKRRCRECKSWNRKDAAWEQALYKKKG